MQKLDLLSQIFCLIQFSRYISRGFPLWLAQVGSNHRPRAYQARALACWAMSQYRLFLPISPLSLFNDSGGDEEIRTLDPLLAGQVLSQLSYTPRGFLFFPDSENRTTKSKLINSTSFAPCCEKHGILFPILILQSFFALSGYFRKLRFFNLRELSP